MPRMGKLRIPKILDVLLGTPDYTHTYKPSLHHPFSDEWMDREDTPAERWKQEEHTAAAHLRVITNPEDSYYKSRVERCERLGFVRGAVVCKADDKILYRQDPSNWGFVVRLLRYKTGEKYKPIEVMWCHGAPDRTFWDETELIPIIQPPSAIELQKIFVDWRRNQCI